MKAYTKKEIIQQLKALGIQPTDSVFFTTSLGMIGVPPKHVDSNVKLNTLFLEAIREVLTDGNILVPTYSYTFGKSTATEPAIFDSSFTPAEIGEFPNFILTQPDVVRSLDPFMSIACIGKDAHTMFLGLSDNSYCEGSFFEKMVRDNAMKCCSIGLGPNWTPFIHYADWLVKAPHRYDKMFYGGIKEGDKLVYKSWIYSVAYLGPESYATAHKVGRLAEAAGIWTHKPLGRARIYVASCREYFNFTLNLLKTDKWLLAKGPAVDVETVERGRISDIDDVILDDSFETSFVKTGEWIGNWLAPERWVCKKALLLDMQGNVLSEQAYLYSLSVNKIVDVATLQKHISKLPKNVYMNRDWGFIFCGELNESHYQIIIESHFGYGTIKIAKKNNQTFALLANSLERIDHKIN